MRLILTKGSKGRVNSLPSGTRCQARQGDRWLNLKSLRARTMPCLPDPDGSCGVGVRTKQTSLPSSPILPLASRRLSAHPPPAVRIVSALLLAAAASGTLFPTTLLAQDHLNSVPGYAPKEEPPQISGCKGTGALSVSWPRAAGAWSEFGRGSLGASACPSGMRRWWEIRPSPGGPGCGWPGGAGLGPHGSQPGPDAGVLRGKPGAERREHLALRKSLEAEARRRYL